jgi:HAD superfamily hydrolase (TIGR01458 family)
MSSVSGDTKVAMNRFAALLCDIDGTLTFQGTPITQAIETIRRLRRADMRIRFLTNNTLQTPNQIAETLRKLGFEIYDTEIETAATACVTFLSQEPSTKSWFLLPESIRPLFAHFPTCTEKPERVVIGDVCDLFNYALLNTVFQRLDDGARLIALHRNPFSYKGERKDLDVGAFISGLELATGRPAVVTGKPSATFFRAAISAVGVPADRTLIVGDDRSTDILGANLCNVASVLVDTGKGLTDNFTGVHPTWRIHSIASLPQLLGIA